MRIHNTGFLYWVPKTLFLTETDAVSQWTLWRKDFSKLKNQEPYWLIQVQLLTVVIIRIKNIKYRYVLVQELFPLIIINTKPWEIFNTTSIAELEFLKSLWGLGPEEE